MDKDKSDFWQALIALPVVLSLLAAPVAAQMPQTRPAARPTPAPERPVARPMPQRPQVQQPQRPAVNRPAPRPSYPTNPGLERPRPQPARPLPPPPNRPGIDRPVTLPSYPNRPGLERPPVRPPIVRPPIRPLPPPRPFPPGIRPPVIIAPGLTWGYRYPVGGGGFARRIRCESWNYRLRICSAYTNGRVVLERRHGGRCRFNRDWGFDLRSIWVRNGCRATFAYGRGGFYPDYNYGRNDTALIIGGVAVAAGLIAAIASDNSSDSRSAPTASPYPPLSSAAIEASDEAIEPAARPAYRLCLQKAASNIAATGGDRLRVVDLTIDGLEDGQYRFDADIEANYPGSVRKLVFNCTSSSVKVADFDFITED